MTREFQTFAEASRFASDYCRSNRVSARVVRTEAGWSVLPDIAPEAPSKPPPYRQSTQLNPNLSNPTASSRTQASPTHAGTPHVRHVSLAEEGYRQIEIRRMLLERELASRPPVASEAASSSSHESCRQCGGDGGAGGRCPRCGGNGFEP
jgi:hypothetical protein